MSELVAALFCAAVGFAMAGTVANFYQLVTARPAELIAAHASFAGNVAAAVVTMIGGPFIIARMMIGEARARRLAPLSVLLGCAAAGMWSVAAGILILGLLIAA